MEKKRNISRKLGVITLCLTLAASAALAFAATKEGLVEYIGAQKQIFATGKAEPVIHLSELADRKNLFAIGPVEGLDGEITIFDSKANVSQVRGDDYQVDHSFNHGAIFLVWSEQEKWSREIAVPETVQSYPDLQNFVREQAKSAGVNTDKPFPFRLSGTPRTVNWHINVNRSEGQAISKAIFAKSKAAYLLKNEPVEIIGFYSETHPGVFISQYAPAIPPDSGKKNAIHMHLIAKDGKATGHIDDLSLRGTMVLRLPAS